MVSGFLALQYLKGLRSNSAIKTMLIWSMISIALTSCSLTLVIAISNGFQHATEQTLKGIHADILVEAPDGVLDLRALKHLIQKEFTEIIGISPSVSQHVLLNYADNYETIPSVAILRAIDPESEKETSALTSHIQHSQDINLLSKKNEILVGKKFAELHNLHRGDTIELMVPSQNAGKKQLRLKSFSVPIGGFFHTGVEEFDMNMVLSSFSFFNRLFPEEEIDTIHLKLAPGSNTQKTIERLKNKTGLEVFSWQNLYPPLVSALALEKYALWLLLLIMALVSMVSLISLMFMIVTHKQRDCAVFYAMGMTKKEVSHTFLYIGFAISIVASSIGFICAGLIGYVIKYYYPIQLPDTYYATHIPIDLPISNCIVIFCLILTTTLFASWMPIRATTRQTWAKLMRSE